jgi:hypothetical protein
MSEMGQKHELPRRSIAVRFAPNKQTPTRRVRCDAHHSWQSDRERRAATRRTLDRDVAPHHLTETPTDGEAKARATVLAVEQLAHLIRCHADASVGHRDRDPITAVLLSLVSGVHCRTANGNGRFTSISGHNCNIGQMTLRGRSGGASVSSKRLCRRMGRR